MENLSNTQKYSVDEIAKALNLTTKLKHGIRQNFGDPISINDLLPIDRKTFLACKNLGLKSWYQFHTAMSTFYDADSAVTLIDKPNFNNIIVKIDISRSFQEVILDLGRLLQKNS
jgi:hypothetical protein